MINNNKMINNLIIKSSYSKLPDGRLKSNFGDLLRSTVLLNCISGDFLWLTDSRSIRLLRWFIDEKKLITFGGSLNHSFSGDLRIYNLDNYAGDERVFRLKGRWMGYIKGEKEGCKEKKGLITADELTSEELTAEDGLIAENKFIEYTEPYRRITAKQIALRGMSWQQALVEGVGFTWREQDFSMVRDSRLRDTGCLEREKIFDIGLNWNVHPEWESKKWPESYWKELEANLKKSCSISWQEGLDDFDEYIRWLLSCRVIVTCDTLGLHLASALRKKVVAIVGPTENNEFSYGRVVFIRPKGFKCIPCNQPKCRKEIRCLETVKPDDVKKVILGLLGCCRA